MSPIKDLSDSVRLPRLGKIKLGTKDPKRGFPRKSDHFVLPTDHSDYKKLVELYGEKPKELPVLIPVEDEETWATQYYKSYTQTHGLVCKGDGEMAMRMVSVETGELPDAKKSGAVRLQERPCAGKDCPDYQNKKCHEVMNLRFILPEVPGLGVWQIDTRSKNSILNINSCAKLIKRAFGRISMIPLKLTLEPIEVNQPDTGKKQTVYVLNLRTNVTMAQLANVAREQAKMFMLEAPDLENTFDVAVEKNIEELWGDGMPVDKAIGEIKEIPQGELKEKVDTRGEFEKEGRDLVKEAIVHIKPKAQAEPEASPDASQSNSRLVQDESSGMTPTQELLSKVAEAKGWKNTKPVRSWLVNGPCKVKAERIDSEPEAVWKEVSLLL